MSRPIVTHALGTLRRHARLQFGALVAACWLAPALVPAGASASDPQTIASSLQRDPVQSLGVPGGSFTALSRTQLNDLRAEIARLDPGRIRIMVVAPRSDAALGTLADPVFGNLPAGTLIAVAEDPRDATVTNFWVGATWKSSDAAQGELNGVIDGFHHGQGSLFDDLRLEIQSFARSDAAAGHLAGAASDSAGSATTHGGSDVVLTAVLIVAVVLALIGVLIAGGRLRGATRASHRRREELADARALTNRNLTELAEQIEALDIASSMPAASTEGKDEYARALDSFEDARQRMQRPPDAYQFEQAVQAIDRGLEYAANADRLLNRGPATHQASARTGPDPTAHVPERP